MKNAVLAALKRGEATGSIWLTTGSVAVAESIASTRPDAIVFDAQHGLWNRESLFAAIASVRDKTVPLVRTADNTPISISTALDNGALGVIVPMIETAEQAAGVVASAKYPPVGMRSSGGVRPLMDFKKYGAEANASIIVAVMVETATGVKNVAQIAAVKGIDMIFIGTGDLSMSLGTFPEYGPRHEQQVRKIQDACREAGVACGVFCGHATFAMERKRQGFLHMAIGDDGFAVRLAAAYATNMFANRADVDEPPLKGGVQVKGSTVLLTGANGGIGQKLLVALLAAGAAKVYATARNPKSLAASAKKGAKRVVPLALDITDEKAIAALAKQCRDVDIVINNAGLNHNTPLMGRPDIAHARAEIETNYFGPLNIGRAFAPILKKNGGGAIVNMLSILARVNLPIMGSLCASKAAALSMTQAMRAELAKQHTLVIGVMPGAVDTAMTASLDGPKMEPAEVAAAVLYAIEHGIEDVFPGDMASGVAAGLAMNPKAVERDFAKYLP